VIQVLFGCNGGSTLLIRLSDVTKLMVKEINNDSCTIGVLQFGIRVKIYYGLEGNLKYESKDRWMSMESQDRD